MKIPRETAKIVVNLIAYIIAINKDYLLTGQGEIQLLEGDELREFINTQTNNDKSLAC